MAEWRPADVVLLTPYGDESRKSALVKEVQRRRGFHRLHADWTHAAIYVGDGAVVHVTYRDPADGNKVVDKQVADFVKLTRIRVRTNDDLNRQDRLAIAARAMELVNGSFRYSRAKAFALALGGQKGDRFRFSEPLFQGIVCSDIVAIAYEGVLRRPVFSSADSRSVLPATLSVSPFLRDINVSWCAIPTVTSQHAREVR